MGIADWQRRFAEQPRVWYVVVAGEATDNFYDTREGAEEEVAFYKRRRMPPGRVVSRPVHSIQLARERWADTEKGEG